MSILSSAKYYYIWNTQMRIDFACRVCVRQIIPSVWNRFQSFGFDSLFQCMKSVNRLSLWPTTTQAGELITWHTGYVKNIHCVSKEMLCYCLTLHNAHASWHELCFEVRKYLSQMNHSCSFSTHRVAIQTFCGQSTMR